MNQTERNEISAYIREHVSQLAVATQAAFMAARRCPNLATRVCIYDMLEPWFVANDHPFAEELWEYPDDVRYILAEFVFHTDPVADSIAEDKTIGDRFEYRRKLKTEREEEYLKRLGQIVYDEASATDFRRMVLRCAYTLVDEDYLNEVFKEREETE